MNLYYPGYYCFYASIYFVFVSVFGDIIIISVNICYFLYGVVISFFGVCCLFCFLEQCSISGCPGRKCFWDTDSCCRGVFWMDCVFFEIRK